MAQGLSVEVQVSLADRISGSLKGINASVDQFKTHFEQAGAAANKTAANWKLAFEGMRPVALGLVAAGGAVVGALGASAQKAISLGSELWDMSKRTQVSVEALSELRYAAGQTGMEMGGVERGLKMISRSSYAAQEGTGAVADAYKALGVNVRDSSGHLKSADAIMSEVGKGLIKLGDDASAPALALKVMGRAGTDLIPMLTEVGGGVEGLRKKAHDLGLTMSTETAQNADTAGDAMATLKASLENLAVAVGSTLVPTLTKLAEVLSDIVGWGNALAKNPIGKALTFAAGPIGVGVLGIGGAVLAAPTIMRSWAVLGAMRTGLKVGGWAAGLGAAGRMAAGLAPAAVETAGGVGAGAGGAALEAAAVGGGTAATAAGTAAALAPTGLRAVLPTGFSAAQRVAAGEMRLALGELAARGAVPVVDAAANTTLSTVGGLLSKILGKIALPLAIAEAAYEVQKTTRQGIGLIRDINRAYEGEAAAAAMPWYRSPAERAARDAAKDQAAVAAQYKIFLGGPPSHIDLASILGPGYPIGGRGPTPGAFTGMGGGFMGLGGNVMATVREDAADVRATERRSEAEIRASHEAAEATRDLTDEMKQYRAMFGERPFEPGNAAQFPAMAGYQQMLNEAQATEDRKQQHAQAAQRYADADEARRQEGLGAKDTAVTHSAVEWFTKMAASRGWTGEEEPRAEYAKYTAQGDVAAADRALNRWAASIVQQVLTGGGMEEISGIGEFMGWDKLNELANADWRNMPGAMHDPVAEAAAAQAAVDAAAEAAKVPPGRMVAAAYGDPGGPTVNVFIGNEQLRDIVYQTIYGTGQEAVYGQ